MTRYSAIAVLGWLFAFPLSSPGKDFKAEIARILKSPDLKGIVTGIQVLDTETGAAVFSLNENRLFAPASNLKLVTTAAAVHFLGADYTFRTSVFRKGEIQGGTLRGDLIVRGSGDPNISGRFYGENITAIPDQWAKTIREAGIETITGDIIADDTIFDREFVCPNWPADQLWKWYCAPTCGLSFNDNCLEVEIRPGAAGEPVQLFPNPETAYAVFENSCTTVETKGQDFVVIDRRAGDATIKVGGRCWAEAGSRRFFVTVDNPALFMVTVFRESLKKAGVKVEGKPRLLTEPLDAWETPGNELAACEHRMKETISVTNKRSQNFYAEQLLKLVGKKVRGQGSFKAGVAACSAFLKEIGVPAESYTLVDGCGLSRENRLTPALLATLLNTMWRHRYNKEFADSLPRPGEDASLRRRFKEAAYCERICAKTGYIDGASSLSGYLSTKSGRLYAFSTLMNDPNVRGFRVSNRQLHAIQDSICKAIIDS